MTLCSVNWKYNPPRGAHILPFYLLVSFLWLLWFLLQSGGGISLSSSNSPNVPVSESKVGNLLITGGSYWWTFLQLVWLMLNLLLSLTGGLICRGILSTLSDHNVQSFISLSSPQAGQYGGGFNFNKLSTWLCRSSCGGCCYYNRVSQIESSGSAALCCVKCSMACPTALEWPKTTVMAC